MRPKLWLALCVGLLLHGAYAPARGSAQEIDWRAVDAAMERSGSMQDGEVYRFGTPRSGLSVTSRGVSARPSFAPGCWLEFGQPGPNGAVARGGLVLTGDELDRVLARPQGKGVGQTAIHEHLLEESPALWRTHAHGDPVRIARIRQALGHGGRDNRGVYDVSVPRAETIRAMGIEVPPSMGLATVIYFQPTGGGRAAIDGDSP
jgi:hypothetical protein